MFFKNDSEAIVFQRTKNGVEEIKPGGLFKALEQDIIQLNSHLTEISEEEYIKLARVKHEPQKQEVKKVVEETKPTVQESVKPVENKTNITDDDKTSTTTKTRKQEKVEVVEETKSEKELLEEELENLKEAWNKANRPNKKAELQKKIKEIEAKLNK